MATSASFARKPHGAKKAASSARDDIAHRRHTSENTVANQVHAIFLKLGVHSRAELAARLQAKA